MCVRKLAWQFLTLPQYINPELNGYRFEVDSPMGVFFRLTALPEEPTVADKYFPHPLQMPEVEKTYVMKRISGKLDKVQV